MSFTWRLHQNADGTWDAVLLRDGQEFDRETFDKPDDGNKWVSNRLREMGAL